jgi:hypothetical protein
VRPCHRRSTAKNHDVDIMPLVRALDDGTHVTRLRHSRSVCGPQPSRDEQQGVRDEWHGHVDRRQRPLTRQGLFRPVRRCHHATNVVSYSVRLPNSGCPRHSDRPSIVRDRGGNMGYVSSEHVLLPQRCSCSTDPMLRAPSHMHPHKHRCNCARADVIKSRLAGAVE